MALAVVISDVHYGLQTLKLADAAMRQAIDKANELNVPLIVSGDLHDTKSVLRGECVKAMIDTLKRCYKTPYILVGNHDLINEKSKEHSLEFLRPYARVIDRPAYWEGLYFIPYQHDPKEFLRHLSPVPEGSIVICHQGVNEADMGDYVQDKSAVRFSELKPCRYIAGHYHRVQTIDALGGGRKLASFSYVGNPYTLSFGEASDGPKGYGILSESGRLSFVATNLRRHRVIIAHSESTWEDTSIVFSPDDLVWVKYSGPRSELARVNKAELVKRLGLPSVNFKLDLIPVEESIVIKKESKSGGQILDQLIDETCESQENKDQLKVFWRNLSST